MATYQSKLIEALRNRPQETLSMSSVSFLPNPVVNAAPPMATKPATSIGGIFNPAKLTMQSIAPNVIGNRMQFASLPGGFAGGAYGGDGGLDMGAFGSSPMTAEQAMNAVAMGRGLSDYGATMVAPGALPAGLIGNAMMNAGQNALSSLDAAMLGMSPGGVDAGGMTAGNSADIGLGYSF